MAKSLSSGVSLFRMKRSMPEVRLVVMEQPVNPVINGKKRSKFPSSKDCFVRVGIFDHENNEISCKYSICYEEQPIATILKSKRNDAKFLLELTITRHAVNESSVIDVPLNMVLLKQPLNYCKNIQKHANNDVGYWFRFFGKACRFHIKISLKALHQVESTLIDTVELDIVNFEDKVITRSVQKPSHTTSLYDEKQYVNIMEKLQTLYENCCWKECRCLGDQLLSEETINDYKVCIILVQSKAACQQGELKDGKLLVKKALDILPGKSKNKDLLTGRAYTCLSLSHQYDMAFVNAEECLRITKTKLINFMPCEDTGDLYYQGGKLLLGFILKLPRIHIEIFNEAKEKFEKALSHFQESYHRIGVMNKIYISRLSIAIVLVLSNSIGTADEIISSIAEISLVLSYEAKCMLYFAKAIFDEKKSDFHGANGRMAFDLAHKHELYLQKQWIKNFVWKFSEPGNEE